ncbi:MAG: Phage antirepressor protein [uncultured Clostridium sp.]
MINNLIKINTNSEEITLSGRELHEFLEIKTPYAKWFGRMIEYGFDENIDYATVGQKCPIANGGYQEVQDHEIKLDMAKEIAMIQRSAKGRQARKYFIEIEKMWNSPEMIIKRALEIANKKIEYFQLINLKQSQLLDSVSSKIII